ncbi:paraquat-inducible protein A [Maricaulis parjimensis]|uniref:paraquat-inducible protein A n=1 Tax=Maricaulis parjimensis TaxID=144023 RepID=UPI001939914F|nr:paraquat-inducible protein A [Maricaulis parjimensis]
MRTNLPGKRKTALADTAKGQASTAGLLLASLLYPIGLFAPAIKTSQIGFLVDDHSLIGLVMSLARHEAWLLALAVGLFSLVFPLTKLVWMWWLQFAPLTQVSHRSIAWLEWLGKWSMADVLVVAVTVFSLRGSFLFNAQPQPGIAVFAAATLIAMLVSGRISAQLREQDASERNEASAS